MPCLRLQQRAFPCVERAAPELPAIAFIHGLVARFPSLGRHHVQTKFNLAQFEDGGARRVSEAQARPEANRETVPIRIRRDRSNHGKPDIGSNIQQPACSMRMTLPCLRQQLRRSACGFASGAIDLPRRPPRHHNATASRSISSSSARKVASSRVTPAAHPELSLSGGEILRRAVPAIAKIQRKPHWGAVHEPAGWHPRDRPVRFDAGEGEYPGDEFPDLRVGAHAVCGERAARDGIVGLNKLAEILDPFTDAGLEGLCGDSPEPARLACGRPSGCLPSAAGSASPPKNTRPGASGTGSRKSRRNRAAARSIQARPSAQEASPSS